MLNKILLLLAIITIVGFISAVAIWRKKYFIKTVYVSGTIAMWIANVSVLVGLIIAVIVLDKENWHLGISIFILSLCVSFFYAIVSTTCIYIENNVLIKRNIFYSIKITLKDNVKLIAKFDRRIVKLGRKRISMNIRYLSGNINTLWNEIEYIVGEKVFYRIDKKN